MRVLRSLALGIGGVVLGVLLIGTVVAFGRWVQVRVAPQPPAAPHLAEKELYLNSLRGADLSTAPNIVVIFFDDLGYAPAGVLRRSPEGGDML